MSFENYTAKNILVVVNGNKAIIHIDQKKILMDHSGISIVYKVAMPLKRKHDMTTIYYKHSFQNE